MRIRNSAALAAALGALLAGSSAFAQSGRPPAGDTVTVGLGVGVSPSYEGADEYKLIPGGNLRGTVAGHDFFLRGLQLNIDAIPNGAVKESVFGIASYNRLQGDFARSPIVADTGNPIQAFGALGIGYTF